MIDESLHSEQSHDKKIAALASKLKERSMSVDDYLSEDEWSDFLQKQDGRDVMEDDPYQPVYDATVRRSKRKKITLYTGISILLIGIGTYFVLQQRQQPEESWAHRNTTNAIEKITLPDNTRVLLYPNSEIAYEGDFQEKDRRLQLTGRSEFNVTQHASKPFVVYCRNVATRVLGTRFLVNGEGENVSVHLYDGKVLVQGVDDSTAQYYLQPGETITYFEKDRRFQLAGASPVQPAAIKKPAKPVVIKSGRAHKPLLEFQNEQLSSIFDYLAEKYKVEIRYPTDQALSTNVMLSIDAGQPVERILQNICRANGLKLVNAGDSIFTVTK